MHDEFTPLLTATDWSEEWKELQKVRRHADDAAFWDKRSATFTTKDAPNLYVEKFLEYAEIRPGETVFDMGCGTGALAVPLGEAGHKVVAADFSQGMLDQMQARLDAAGVRTVFPKLMSWEDDWPAFGVREGMTDVAIASRSIATADLRDALLRLTEVARRRVCITLATGSSPASTSVSWPPWGCPRCSDATTCTRSTSWPMRGSRQRCATSTAPATIRSPPPRTPTRS